MMQGKYEENEVDEQWEITVEQLSYIFLPGQQFIVSGKSCVHYMGNIDDYRNNAPIRNAIGQMAVESTSVADGNTFMVKVRD